MSYDINYDILLNNNPINITSNGSDNTLTEISNDSYNLRSYNLFIRTNSGNITNNTINIKFYLNNSTNISSSDTINNISLTSTQSNNTFNVTTPFDVKYKDSLKIVVNIQNSSPSLSSSNYIIIEKITLNGYGLPVLFNISYSYNSDGTPKVDTNNNLTITGLNLIQHNFIVDFNGSIIPSSSIQVVNNKKINIFSIPTNIKYGMIKYSNNYGIFYSYDIQTGSVGYGPNIYFWSSFRLPNTYGNLIKPSHTINNGLFLIKFDNNTSTKFLDFYTPIEIRIGQQNKLLTNNISIIQYEDNTIYFSSNESDIKTSDSNYISIIFRNNSNQNITKTYSSSYGIHKFFTYQNTLYNPYRYDGFLQLLSLPEMQTFTPNKSLLNTNININANEIVSDKTFTKVKLSDNIVSDINYSFPQTNNITCKMILDKPDYIISVCNYDGIYYNCSSFDVSYGNLSTLPVINKFYIEPNSIVITNSTKAYFIVTNNFVSSYINYNNNNTNITNLLPNGNISITPINAGDNIYTLSVTNNTGTVTKTANVNTYYIPIITSFSPLSASETDTVEIIGTLRNIDKITVGDIPVSFNVVNNNKINITIKDNGGLIKVFSGTFSDTSQKEFELIPLNPEVNSFTFSPESINYNYIGNFLIKYDFKNLDQSFINGSAVVNGNNISNLSSGEIILELPKIALFTLVLSNKYKTEIFNYQIPINFDRTDYYLNNCINIGYTSKKIKNSYNEHITFIGKFSNSIKNANYIRNKKITFSEQKLNEYKRWYGAPGGSGGSIKNDLL